MQNDRKHRHPILANTAMDVRLLGTPSFLTSFPQHISASRADMYNHHLSQAMVIRKPEPNKIFTGIEPQLIAHEMEPLTREFDCEILAVIPKYTREFIENWAENCPERYVIVRTIEPHGKSHIDCFIMRRYTMGTNGFGYIPIYENTDRLLPGEIIPRDMVFMHSAAVQGNNYCFGVNLNTIYGSFPEVIEDAFIISRSAARKLETDEITRTIINCRQDRRPLNLNGDEFMDQFLPNIGSYVREDGALCGFRPTHAMTVAADIDPEALREILPYQDKVIYVEPGSKIADISFAVRHKKMNDCYPQVVNYMKNQEECWKKIYTLFGKYGNRYPLTNRMHTLVKTAIHRLVAHGVRVPGLDNMFRTEINKAEIEGFDGHLVDFMQAEVITTRRRFVIDGSKLTDTSGGKGVVATIYPDECMPVDEFGIRADVWVDMHTPVSRNNFSQHYECGINRIGEFVRRKVQAIKVSGDTEKAFRTLTEWFRDVNPIYADLVEKRFTDKASKDHLVNDMVNNGVRMFIPSTLDSLTGSREDKWRALRNIKAWALKWDVRPSRVTYKTRQRDGSYKEFTTIGEFSIGSKYFLHLNKLPKQTSPGFASVNHLGIPVKSNQESKNFPVSTNPYKFGEDEIRVMCMDSPAKEVYRFLCLGSNSPTGTKMLIQSLLEADNPTRIRRVPITNAELTKTNAVLRVFHGSTTALGVETRTTAIGAVSIPDHLKEAIWNTEAAASEEDDDDVAHRRRPKGSGRRKQPIEEIDEDIDEDEMITSDDL